MVGKLDPEWMSPEKIEECIASFRKAKKAENSYYVGGYHRSGKIPEGIRNSIMEGVTALEDLVNWCDLYSPESSVKFKHLLAGIKKSVARIYEPDPAKILN